MAEFITSVATVSELTTWYTSTVPASIPAGDRYIAELASGDFPLAGVTWTGKTYAEAGQVVIRAAAAARPNKTGAAARFYAAGATSAVISHTFGGSNSFGAGVVDGFVFEDVGFSGAQNGGFAFAAGTLLRRCVLQKSSTASTIAVNGTARLANCIAVSTVAAAAVVFNGSGAQSNNTLIGFADFAALGLQGSFQNAVWKNNVALNLSASPTVDPWPTPPTSYFGATSSNNGTSHATTGNCPGTSPLVAVAPGAIVAASSAAALDARPVSGSALLAAGAVVANNGGTDWYGAARSGSAPTVGATEAAYVVDTTAPTLTSPTGTSTGATTASGTVNTDEAGGTLYRLASTNATETIATVKAAGLTSVVTATGVQAVSFSGLAAGTTYYAQYVHTDAAGNDSARVSSASFTTDASGDTTAPTISGSITIGAVTSTTIQMSWPAGADNVAVVGYDVSSNGGSTWVQLGNVLTHTFSGLTAGTTYALRVRPRDAAGNVGAAPLSASQATSAPAPPPPPPVSTGAPILIGIDPLNGRLVQFL